MIVGGLAAIPTCGVSIVGTIIGGRRVDVNTDRIQMIEVQLRKKGWDGHKKNWKDYALPVALGAVGLGFSTGVEGALIDGISGGVPPPPDITPPIDNTSVAIPTDHGSSIPTVPGVDSNTIPAPPAPGFPPSTQINPVEIPNTSVILTENGIQPAINGVPVGPDYGQVTSSGLFQAPIDPSNPYFPGPENYLTYADGPTLDPSAPYWQDANQVPLDTQPDIPGLQTDIPYTLDQDILPPDSGYGEAPPDLFPGDTTLESLQAYGIVDLQPSWHDAVSGATATAVSTLVCTCLPFLVLQILNALTLRYHIGCTHSPSRSTRYSYSACSRDRQRNRQSSCQGFYESPLGHFSSW